MKNKATSNVIGFVLVLLIITFLGVFFFVTGGPVIVENTEISNINKIESDMYEFYEKTYNSVGEKVTNNINIGYNIDYPFFITKKPPTYEFKAIDTKGVKVITETGGVENSQYTLNKSIIRFESNYNQITDVIYYYENSILIRQSNNGKVVLNSISFIKDNKIELYLPKSNIQRSYQGSSSFNIYSKNGSEGPRNLDLPSNYDNLILDVPTHLTLSEWKESDLAKKDYITISDSPRTSNNDEINYARIIINKELDIIHETVLIG